MRKLLEDHPRYFDEHSYLLFNKLEEAISQMAEFYADSDDSDQITLFASRLNSIEHDQIEKSLSRDDARTELNTLKLDILKFIKMSLQVST